MPINPNIALGVQPVQQTNVLGQMGQMMALRAAQQEMQGNEELRAASSGNIADPEVQRRMRMANPRMASQILNQFSEMSARDIKTQNDSLKTIKENVSLVNSPAEMAEYLKGAYSTPGGALLAKLVPYDKAIAAIPSDPRAFAEYKRNLGLTSDKLFESADAQLKAKVDREGHGVQRRGQDITATTAANRLEFYKTKQDVIEGADGYIRKDPYGNLYRVEGYGTMRGPNAPAAPLPPAAANAFVTTRPPVANALAPTAPPVVQPGLPTVANALAMEQQQNVPRPKQTTAPTLTEVDDPANPGQKLKIDARVYRGGTVGDPGVLGVARTENLTPAQKQKLKQEIGKDFDALNRVVGQTNELMESIDAVRNSSLEKVAGPIDARTPSLFKEAQVAETRFNNLKGKVTAIAKANASLGGAIGSIANQEWQILANQIAVLDLAGGKTANLEQIEKLEREAMSIVNRMRDGFERKYGADIETLAPQYKEIPSVSYTPGQYTATGRKSSGIDNTNPWLK